MNHNPLASYGDCNFPKRVKILGTWWTVNVTHEFPSELLGHTNSVIKEILIRPNAEAEVFIHELIHAVAESFGHDIEEDTIKILGRGLFSILSDNENVREYLLKEFE